MSNYAYVAIDPRGMEMRGTLEVADQSEALRRIKEMGLFPTKVVAKHGRIRAGRQFTRPKSNGLAIKLPFFGARVKSASLTTFTRQTATLLEAGMPLLRGLRTLQEQEEDRALRQIIGELALAIENGGSFAEAVMAHPKVFNELYVNMVKAGEIGGALDVSLKRLAEFMEKARRLKGKVKAAMYYPACVLTAATAILILLMAYVVPRFQAVFEGLVGTNQMPAFTRFVLRLSGLVKDSFIPTALAFGVLAIGFALALWTRTGTLEF